MTHPTDPAAKRDKEIVEAMRSAYNRIAQYDAPNKAMTAALAVARQHIERAVRAKALDDAKDVITGLHYDSRLGSVIERLLDAIKDKPNG